MQYRNKIIAFFTTVCLLVTSLCVPVGASGSSGMMLYNGIVLPDIESVWDKDMYDYSGIISYDNGTTYIVTFSSGPITFRDNSLAPSYTMNGPYILYELVDSSWVFLTEGSGAYQPMRVTNEYVWSNHDILTSSGSVCLAASDPVSVGGSSGSGFDGEATSILSAILSGVTQSNNLLGSMSTIFDNMNDYVVKCYLKLVQIETNTSQLATLLTPSEEETALKTATSDVTAAFTEQFWGENSDNAFDGASVTESADILNETKQLFNTGVSTSDFFSLFGDSSWGHWFSSETRDDLDTVPSVSALDLYEDEEKSAYEKNLDAIRDFMGG